MVDRRRGGRSTAGRPAAAAGAGGGSKGGDVPRKGEKGSGKGKDDARKGAVKGSSKGKGEGKNTSSFQAPEQMHVHGAKTVQELEAEMLNSKGAGSTKERREAAKQPLEAKGSCCEVKKHSEMGCAVVSFPDQASRDAVMRLAAHKATAIHKEEEVPIMKIGGVDIQLRPHYDKAKQEDVGNQIFVAWGRQAEKMNILGASLIAEAIDLLMMETGRGGMTPETQASLSPLVVPQLSPQMLPQSLTQMLPQPMMGHQVQSPQQQQLDYMRMLWAAQQQQAAQQQAAQMQQAPPSPQPSTQPLLGLETPPRSGQMRANAQEFTPPPVGQQPQFLDQYAMNEVDQYADWNYDQTAYAQPTKRFEIVNPNTKETITAPKNTLSEGAAVFVPEVPALPARKPVKIVDPNTNIQVDTLGMIFEKPKPGKTFSIMDPTSGSPIKV